MFRRKEEGLFDTNTDPNQLQEDIATALSEPAAQATANTYQQPAAGNTGASFGAGNNAAYGAQNNQQQAAPRPNTSAPTANSFRPNAAAPISGDMARNRLPEAKPAPVAAAAPVQQAAPAPVSANTASDKSKTKRVLTVGNDILLKGEIATCDRLVIEGKVDATLNDVHTVEIAEGGSFKGSAQIEDAEISGLFEGDLTVRGRLVIYATGKVRGKISYGEIEIERGGELTGEIKIAGASAIGSRPTSARQNAPKEEKVAA